MIEPEILIAQTEDAFLMHLRSIIDSILIEKKKPEINQAIKDMCDDTNLMMEHVLVLARSMFEHENAAHPSYLLYSAAGNGTVVPLMFEDMPSDAKILASIAAAISLPVNTVIDAYVFMSEVFMAEVSANDDRLPSQRPDKKEALSIIVHRPGGISEHRFFNIDRDVRGQCVGLSPSVFGVEKFEKFEINNPMMKNLYDLVPNSRIQMLESITVH